MRVAWCRAARLAALALAVYWSGSAVRAGEPSAEAFPVDLLHWTPAAENPVFTAAPAGQWDARIRERGWILRDGDRWQMWYTGYDGSRLGMRQLGYATSNDGLHWQRYANNPIYRQHWVEDACVVRAGDTYYMFAEGLHDRAQWLTSADGIHWQRQGLLDVRTTAGEPIARGPYGTPAVWLESSTWHLLYERGDLGLWLARSTDLRTWTNVQDAPVMQPGPGVYDDRAIAANQVVRRDGRYFLVYHGSGRMNPKLWCTCLASSEDLLHWTKYPANPLLGDNKSSGILVDDGQQLRLYTMHDQVQVHYPQSLTESVNGRRAP